MLGAPTYYLVSFPKNGTKMKNIELKHPLCSHKSQIMHAHIFCTFVMYYHTLFVWINQFGTRTSDHRNVEYAPKSSQRAYRKKHNKT